MDLTATPQQEDLRAELRSWLAANLPWEYGTGLPPHFDDLAEEVTFLRSWQTSLAGAGWVGVTWPTAYGGRGLGPVENFVVQEELARARAPELVGRIGVNLAGPTLLEHGTDDQKLRCFLRSCEPRSCGASSSASPTPAPTSHRCAPRATPVARRIGARGQKVWTSYAQFADWGICLARSGPAEAGHRGLSFFVVDMHDPGVEVSPSVRSPASLSSTRSSSTTYSCPRLNSSGPKGEGWRVAGSTLTRERGVNPRQLVIHLQHLEELLRTAVATRGVRRSALEPASCAGVRRGPPVPAPQLALAFESRARQGARPRRQRPQALLERDEQAPARPRHGRSRRCIAPVAGRRAQPGDGSWQRAWLYYQASSIFAGTNEIQRSVIGERVLGLPREPSGAGAAGPDSALGRSDPMTTDEAPGRPRASRPRASRPRASRPGASRPKAGRPRAGSHRAGRALRRGRTPSRRSP